jgi:succinyl-CoA synthetase beta subunit
LRLYEYQAKRIFAENGLKVPRGVTASDSYEVYETVREFGSPVAVKAQVLIGGRGLAGGVGFAEDPHEARGVADKLLGGAVRGEDVQSVLIEEKVPISREFYVGCLMDPESEGVVMMASSRGGVDVESIASEYPGEIVKEVVDPVLGLTDFSARRIAKGVGLEGRTMLSFANTLKTVYAITTRYDATLVEVNPLALTVDGVFVAVDAKMTLDDNASFRHGELFKNLMSERPVPSGGSKLRKYRAEKAEIPTYIELDGDIGIVADGAGTGMLTLDLTKEHGGDVGVYCELGGRATPNLIEEALGIVSSNADVRVILVNLIGGLNRMDEMAEGIKAFMAKYRDRVSEKSIVVRMSGTLESEGRRILKDSGISAYDNIYEAIDACVGHSGDE